MYEEHPVFIAPENKEVKIWRYMDFAKFVSILEKETLFFTRSDKFRDAFEGTIARYNQTLYKEYYGQHGHTDEQINIFLKDTKVLNNALRERTIISCWHINDYESATMWDQYLKSMME